jgi:hypothetical protein
VILPWLAGARVQADLIQWSASGSAVESTQGLSYIGIDEPWSKGGVYMSNGPKTNGTNSGSVLLTMLKTYDDNTSGENLGTGINVQGNYDLHLGLRDLASGASGSPIFHGSLVANFGFNGGEITNTFLGSTTQTLALGKNLYTVTVGPFIPPGSPTDLNTGMGGTPGSISASIAVQPQTNSTPEPSSLLLACLGLPWLGLTVWRRRKVVAADASKA